MDRVSNKKTFVSACVEGMCVRIESETGGVGGKGVWVQRREIFRKTFVGRWTCIFAHSFALSLAHEYYALKASA